MADKVLAPYARFGIIGKSLRLGVGSKVSLVENQALQEAIMQASLRWVDPAPMSVVCPELADRYGSDIAEAAVDCLIEQRLLVDATDLDLDEQFCRSQLYYLMEGAAPSHVQRRLADAHVTVIGCGGIGSNIAIALAASGIGRMLIIDGDVVEASNITRQWVFKREDIAKKKVDVLKREMAARNNEIGVIAHPFYVSGAELGELVPEGSFIICAADGGSDLMRCVNDLCVTRKQALMSGGYSYDVAVCGPLLKPGDTACYFCPDMYLEPPGVAASVRQAIRQINKRHIAPAVDTLTMLATNLATFDIIRYLGEFGEVRSYGVCIGFVPATLEVQRVEWRQHPECPICKQTKAARATHKNDAHHPI